MTFYLNLPQHTVTERLLDTLEIVSINLSVLIMNILHCFSYLRCGPTYGSVNCLFEENLAIPWNKNELLESERSNGHPFHDIFINQKLAVKIQHHIVLL